MLGKIMAVGSGEALVPTILTFSPEGTSWLPSPPVQEGPLSLRPVSHWSVTGRPPSPHAHSTQKAISPSPAISHLRSSRTP